MQTAYLTVPGGLRVKVRVLAKKLAYGRTLWQGTPVARAGGGWVFCDGASVHCAREERVGCGGER